MKTSTFLVSLLVINSSFLAGHVSIQLFGNVNPQTTIARINGQDISPDNFNNRVNQQLQNSFRDALDADFSDKDKLIVTSV